MRAIAYPAMDCTRLSSTANSLLSTATSSLSNAFLNIACLIDRAGIPASAGLLGTVDPMRSMRSMFPLVFVALDIPHPQRMRFPDVANGDEPRT